MGGGGNHEFIVELGMTVFFLHGTGSELEPFCFYKKPFVRHVEDKTCR